MKLSVNNFLFFCFVLLGFGVRIWYKQSFLSSVLSVVFFVLLSLVIFGFFHLIFRKKFKFSHFLLFFGVIGCVIVDKLNGVFGWDNVDVGWHLVLENISCGFPAFFVFSDLFDFLFFGFGLFLLPLFFGVASVYVCLVWLNSRRVNFFVLLFLFWFFLQSFSYFFSFSRDSVSILFGLLFFYFLEKFYYKGLLKNLVAGTLFLCLACLTKVTGFLLIPFLFCVVVQKKVSGLFLFPIGGILFYLFYFTNLSSNLLVVVNNLSVFFVVGSFVVLVQVFPLCLLFLFLPFFKPKSFLWQVVVYYFFILFFVGLKFSFLENLLIAENLFRYSVVFLFPFILWLSVEFDLFWVLFKRSLRKYGFV